MEGWACFSLKEGGRRKEGSWERPLLRNGSKCSMRTRAGGCPLPAGRRKESGHGDSKNPEMSPHLAS